MLAGSVVRLVARNGVRDPAEEERQPSEFESSELPRGTNAVRFMS